MTAAAAPPERVIEFPHPPTTARTEKPVAEATTETRRGGGQAKAAPGCTRDPILRNLSDGHHHVPFYQVLRHGPFWPETISVRGVESVLLFVSACLTAMLCHAAAVRSHHRRGHRLTVRTAHQVVVGGLGHVADPLTHETAVISRLKQVLPHERFNGSAQEATGCPQLDRGQALTEEPVGL